MIPAGRLPDKYHNGVPADHFRAAPRQRHRFRDPLLATMAAVAAATGAVMQVAVEECEGCADEDHFGSTSKSTTTKPWDGSASRFSDDQYKMATAACDPDTGTEDGPSVKQGCFLPHHEPDGTINVNGVHVAAQRASSVKGHDSGAVSKAKSHLRSHYAKLKEDPPDSIKASAETQEAYAEVLADIERLLNETPAEPRTLGEMFASLHEKFSGTHSHAHAAYGQQGGDQTHDHAHTHADDNLHRHEHAETAATEGEPVAAAGTGRRPQLTASYRTQPPAETVGWWESIVAGLAFVAGAQPGHIDPMLGSSWAVKQEGEQWYVLTAAGPWEDPVGSYAEALAVIAQQLADQGDDRPILSTGWKSEMAYEGVSTGDGRFIENGAIQYRDCPMPLMLQTETESGHFGAVLCGAIMQTGKIGQIAIGAGDWDASDAGRQALQIVQARDRFGVSIDVCEAEGQPICDQHGTDTDQCDFDCDWEIHFSLVKVMGLTMTPFPAFEDAYIEVAAAPAATGQAQTAAAAGTAADTGEPVTAAGKPNPAGPPAEYFELPKHWADMLVPQPSGGMAVPLAVEPPDEHGWRRVYGHVADKLTCHTGIPDRCQRAPMTRDGKYPGFNLKPIMTAEGDLVNVGHITMGCGHASTTMRLAPDQVRAHYDGAPGAVSMAWAHAGQDEHGPWIAGVINPARSEDEIEQFAMCSLSGDWRKEWAQRGYDLFAVLAGVFVPGFPIAAAGLIAAGLPVPTGPGIPTEPCYEMDEQGDPLALVAMGVVRQPMPWEREIAGLRRELAARDEAYDRMAATLRPVAAAFLTARLEGRDPMEMFAAPTPVDKVVTAALQRVLQALDAAVSAQQKDPDNGTDPDDAVVDSDLKHLQQALQKTIADHAKDAAQDDDEPVAANA